MLSSDSTRRMMKDLADERTIAVAAVARCAAGLAFIAAGIALAGVQTGIGESNGSSGSAVVSSAHAQTPDATHAALVAAYRATLDAAE